MSYVSIKTNAYDILHPRFKYQNETLLEKLLTCPLFLAASKLSFIRGERGDRGDRGENESLYEGSKS